VDSFGQVPRGVHTDRRNASAARARFGRARLTRSVVEATERDTGSTSACWWCIIELLPSSRPLFIWRYEKLLPSVFVTNFIGEQGSAKSCAAKIVRMLVDPSETPLRSPSREERDLLVQAANNWCVALDNLSGLQPWLSDGLCRLATGGGHSARPLYTDGEEFSLSVKRPVILNGIDDAATVKHQRTSKPLKRIVAGVSSLGAGAGAIWIAIAFYRVGTDFAPLTGGMRGQDYGMILALGGLGVLYVIIGYVLLTSPNDV